MKVVFDIECNSLDDPNEIWLIVAKDIEKGEVHVFRRPTFNQGEQKRFREFSSGVSLWVGHNIIGYDIPVINRNLDVRIDVATCRDTLVISRLVDYSREGGHSLEQYGEELKHEKKFFLKFNDPELLNINSQLFRQLEDYCIRDIEISHKVYLKYLSTFDDPSWSSAIDLEQRFQLICNDLHNNGFAFNSERAKKLLEKVQKELGELDDKIQMAFPPRQVKVREFTPRATKFGTIAKNSVPRIYQTRIHEFEIGKSYDVLQTQVFNPSSHKQIIDILQEAGWKPEVKTSTHIQAERNKDKEKIKKFKIYGWKVNEDNLNTLPPTAPAPARLLAKRILLESRRRSLTEWLGLVQEDSRIHGKFYGIGAWTHRMSHQQPNTANIPLALKEDGSPKLLGKEMRELWCAPKKRLLVGCDAEGIQLRVFAHYIEDGEFTDALVRGRKSDKSDPHSLNQRIIGSCCKTRQAAKRFIYALLLGAGISKLSSILEASVSETEEALDRLLQRYQGWRKLRERVFPIDAKRGFFIGLDGRKISIPSSKIRDRKHLCMSGYLQSGEAIIIKRAALLIDKTLSLEKDLRKWFFVDIVHDELQSEVHNDMGLALRIAEINASAIKEAGEYYKLKCPMAGSYWNDDHQKYTIGNNWYLTH